MIRQEVIEWILQREQAQYSAGTALLERLDPTHKLLTSPPTLRNLKFLKLELGTRLKNNQLTEIQRAQQEQNYQPAAEIDADITPDLSTEARINKDIQRMIRIERGLSAKLVSASSDLQRMKIYAEADIVSGEITKSKQILNQLQKGQKVEYKNVYFSKPEETDFHVPSNPLELDKKYRYMMSKRSKRKEKAEKYEQKHGRDSLKHQQALAEWKQADDAVKHLKSALDAL
jgi:hypothetical protein